MPVAGQRLPHRADISGGHHAGNGVFIPIGNKIGLPLLLKGRRAAEKAALVAGAAEYPDGIQLAVELQHFAPTAVEHGQDPLRVDMQVGQLADNFIALGVVELLISEVVAVVSGGKKRGVVVAGIFEDVLSRRIKAADLFFVDRGRHRKHKILAVDKQVGVFRGDFPLEGFPLGVGEQAFPHGGQHHVGRHLHLGGAEKVGEYIVGPVLQQTQIDTGGGDEHRP